MLANGQPEFVDNGTAPEFFVNGLHDVEIMGPVARFVPFVTRHTAEGVTYRERPFSFIVPVEAVPPAIALTWRKLPTGLIIPAVGEVARSFLH